MVAPETGRPAWAHTGQALETVKELTNRWGLLPVIMSHGSGSGVGVVLSALEGAKDLWVAVTVASGYWAPTVCMYCSEQQTWINLILMASLFIDPLIHARAIYWAPTDARHCTKCWGYHSEQDGMYWFAKAAIAEYHRPGAHNANLSSHGSTGWRPHGQGVIRAMLPLKAIEKEPFQASLWASHSSGLVAG